MYKQIEGTEIIDVLNGVIKTVEELKERVEADLKVSSTVEEIIEHEGLKLKRVNREAREGDYVRLVGNTSSLYTNGKIYGPVIEKCGKACLESDEGATLSLYRGDFNRTPSTVEVFEVIDVQAEKLPFPEVVEEKPKLTANQQRALVIQEAKQFLASKVKDGIVKIGDKDYKVHFNRKGKTISCILNDLETGYTTYVNKASCHPHDVFNEYIGQAIALGGIIGTPKKMFLKAVQPDELEVGMEVKLHGNSTGHDYFGTDTFDEVEKISDTEYRLSKNERGLVNGLGRWSKFKTQFDSILADTNAQYEVTEC